VLERIGGDTVDLGHEGEKNSVKIGSIIKSKNNFERFWRKCSFRKENNCGGNCEKR